MNFDASEAYEAVLEVLTEHGLGQMEAALAIGDMMKRGIVMIKSDDMAAIAKEKYDSVFDELLGGENG